MLIPKKGEIYINRGFERSHKREFWCSVVRVMNVCQDQIQLQSLSDNTDANFNFGRQLFVVDLVEFNKIFRPKRPGDIEKYKKARAVHRILYADARNRTAP